MAKPRRRSNEERREQSTETVLQSALELFVGNGYIATSIDDIARRAGLTKGAVYFYFKDKSSLMLELLEQSAQLYADIFQQMQLSEKSATEQLEMFVAWSARIGAENKELLLLPILISLEFHGREERIEAAVGKMYQRYHDEMQRVYTQGLRDGEFQLNLPVREQAAVLVAFTDGMLLEWYRWADKLDGRALAN
ncbi:MAG: TetR/AcrR family transcriptional regulator, partial [Pseudomonadales bacterium]